MNSWSVNAVRGMQGEPIKIGHHSEGRHRRLIERADNDMRKSCELTKKAEHYDNKADGVGGGGISSDDDSAVEQLRVNLAGLEKKQETMKAANKIIKQTMHKGQSVEESCDAFVAAGFDREKAIGILTPDVMGGIGFPHYALTNNNANMRRIRQRIKTLEACADHETVELYFDGGRIVDNVEENRLQLFFDEKPEAETRSKLKRGGFRWASSVGAWQRHRSNAATYNAKEIVGPLSASER